MILADLGASTASRAVDELRDRAKHQHINTKEELRDVLCDILSEMMQEDSALDISKKPAVILVIGVNGVGKTTTIGKLAASYTAQGMRVMLSAADTFRCGCGGSAGNLGAARRCGHCAPRRRCRSGRCCV